MAVPNLSFLSLLLLLLLLLYLIVRPRPTKIPNKSRHVFVNQGVFVPGELEKQGLDEVRFMVDVNLIGSFNMIKAALPGMKDRKDRGPGSIALLSSQAGQVGIYGYTAYSASKFGLRGMVEALQQEVIAYDIHVSLIFPLDTDTPGLVEGLLLSIATAGMSPQRSFVMAFVEVIATGVLRIAALGFQWNWEAETTLEIISLNCEYRALNSIA
ncbi:hypothetical protein M0R45_020610 [Rubus argutus]|uniref:Uncharacterized protein n=1 Tax=Rubus argutus TaxID=59490 RepID=A0AAW1XA21_RUBAR